MHHRTGRVVGALVAVALLSACGDDDTASTAGGQQTATSAESSGEGEPIVVMNVSSLTGPAGQTSPEAVTALEAAAVAINADGGINGRPIEIESCDDRVDPNQAAECGRRAAQVGAVATIGDVSPFGANYVPSLGESDIAMIGAFPNDQSDFSDPVSFPVSGGTPTLMAGAGSLLADVAGAENVHGVFADFPGVAAFTELFDDGLESRGVSKATNTLVPVGAPDLSVAVAAASSADGIASLLLENDSVRFISEARSAGVDVPIAATALTNQGIESLGGNTEDVLVVGFFEPVSAGGATIDRYIDEMTSYDPEVPLDSLTAVNSWVSLQVFAEVARSLETVDAESVLAAMSDLEALDIGGFIPPLTTTVEFNLDGFGRLFNHTIYYTEIADGELLLVESGPVDPFADRG